MSALEQLVALRRAGRSAEAAFAIMAPFEPKAALALRQLKQGRALAAILHAGWLPASARGLPASALDDPMTLRLIALRHQRAVARRGQIFGALWMPLLLGASSLVGGVVMAAWLGGAAPWGGLWGLAALLGIAGALLHPRGLARLTPLLATREARLEAATLLAEAGDAATAEALAALIRLSPPGPFIASLRRAQQAPLASWAAAPQIAGAALTRPLSEALLLGAALDDTPRRLLSLAATEAAMIQRRLRQGLRALAWAWVLWIGISGAVDLVSSGLGGLGGGLGGGLEDLERQDAPPELRQLMRELGM